MFPSVATDLKYFRTWLPWIKWLLRALQHESVHQSLEERRQKCHRATLSVWLPKKGVLLGFHTIDESSWLDWFAGQLLAPTGGMTDDRFELEGEGTAREGELEPKNRTPTNGKHVR